MTFATLNRPGQLNAINKEILEALKSLVDVLETDRSVRVLVITGSGEKAFCVGADLKERQGMNEKDILLRMDSVHKLYLRIERLPIPVIAALNGLALGGGLELALTADLRIADAHATFGFPEVELGIIPGNGGTQRLTRIVGIAKALELILLSERVTATEAKACGLVQTVVEAGKLREGLDLWISKLLEVGPVALRQAKLAIRRGIDRSLEEGLAVEVEAYKDVLYSKDRFEGLRAFLEKRKPVYRGE